MVNRPVDRLNNHPGGKQRCGGSPSDGSWDKQEELQGGSRARVGKAIQVMTFKDVIMRHRL